MSTKGCKQLSVIQWSLLRPPTWHFTNSTTSCKAGAPAMLLLAIILAMLAVAATIARRAGTLDHSGDRAQQDFGSRRPLT